MYPKESEGLVFNSRLLLFVQMLDGDGRNFIILFRNNRLRPVSPGIPMLETSTSVS